MPWYLPPFPPDYTYDDGPPSDSGSREEKNVAERRGLDQAKIKEKLNAMLKKQQAEDDGSDIELICDLVKTEEIGTRFLVWPTKMLQTSVAVMDGRRTDVDPEFLPLLKGEEMFPGQVSKDTKQLLSIIGIKHSQYDLGKVEKEKEKSQVSKDGD
jgi:hypothetical protein